MKFDGSSCKLLYNQRPTRCISQFKQWLWSKFYLQMRTVVNSWFLGQDKSKQMELNDAVDEWRWNFSSTVLESAPINVCHGRSLMEQCCSSWNSDETLLQFTSNVLVDVNQWGIRVVLRKFLQKNQEEKLREFLLFRSRSE